MFDAASEGIRQGHCRELGSRAVVRGLDVRGTIGPVAEISLARHCRSGEVTILLDVDERVQHAWFQDAGLIEVAHLPLAPMLAFSGRLTVHEFAPW